MKVSISITEHFCFVILNTFVLSSYAVNVPNANQHNQLVLNATQVKLLRIVAVQKQPFIYRDENIQFYKGIDFELLKIVQSKENVQFSFSFYENSIHLTRKALK